MHYFGNVIMKYEEFVRTYDTCISWLEYSSLTSAIPSNWKTKLIKEEQPNDTNYVKIMRHEKWLRLAYSKFIEDGSERILNKTTQKINTYEINVNEEQVVKAFRNINKITDIIKYRDFQYRLLHKAIVCADRLYHMKILQTNLCRLCHMHKESPKHLFFECKYAQNMYKHLNDTYKIPKVSWENVILNNINENPQHKSNLMVIITKQYLYRCACQDKEPNTRYIENEIKFIQKIQYNKAITTGSTAKYNRNWDENVKDDEIVNYILYQVQ